MENGEHSKEIKTSAGSMESKIIPRRTQKAFIKTVNIGGQTKSEPSKFDFHDYLQFKNIDCLSNKTKVCIPRYRDSICRQLSSKEGNDSQGENNYILLEKMAEKIMANKEVSSSCISNCLQGCNNNKSTILEKNQYSVNQNVSKTSALPMPLFSKNKTGVVNSTTSTYFDGRNEDTLGCLDKFKNSPENIQNGRKYERPPQNCFLTDECHCSKATNITKEIPSEVSFGADRNNFSNDWTKRESAVRNSKPPQSIYLSRNTSPKGHASRKDCKERWMRQVRHNFVPNNVQVRLNELMEMKENNVSFALNETCFIGMDEETDYFKDIFLTDKTVDSNISTSTKSHHNDDHIDEASNALDHPMNHNKSTYDTSEVSIINESPHFENTFSLQSSSETFKFNNPLNRSNNKPPPAQNRNKIKDDSTMGYICGTSRKRNSAKKKPSRGSANSTPKESSQNERPKNNIEPSRKKRERKSPQRTSGETSVTSMDDSKSQTPSLLSRSNSLRSAACDKSKLSVNSDKSPRRSSDENRKVKPINASSDNDRTSPNNGTRPSQFGNALPSVRKSQTNAQSSFCNTVSRKEKLRYEVNITKETLNNQKSCANSQDKKQSYRVFGGKLIRLNEKRNCESKNSDFMTKIRSYDKDTRECILRNQKIHQICGKRLTEENYRLSKSINSEGKYYKICGGKWVRGPPCARHTSDACRVSPERSSSCVKNREGSKAVGVMRNKNCDPPVGASSSLQNYFSDGEVTTAVKADRFSSQVSLQSPRRSYSTDWHRPAGFEKTKTKRKSFVTRPSKSVHSDGFRSSYRSLVDDYYKDVEILREITKMGMGNRGFSGRKSSRKNRLTFNLNGKRRPSQNFGRKSSPGNDMKSSSMSSKGSFLKRLRKHVHFGDEEETEHRAKKPHTDHSVPQESFDGFYTDISEIETRGGNKIFGRRDTPANIILPNDYLSDDDTRITELSPGFGHEETSGSSLLDPGKVVQRTAPKQSSNEELSVKISPNDYRKLRQKLKSKRRERVEPQFVSESPGKRDSSIKLKSAKNATIKSIKDKFIPKVIYTNDFLHYTERPLNNERIEEVVDEVFLEKAPGNGCCNVGNISGSIEAKRPCDQNYGMSPSSTSCFENPPNLKQPGKIKSKLMPGLLDHKEKIAKIQENLSAYRCCRQTDSPCYRPKRCSVSIDDDDFLRNTEITKRRNRAGCSSRFITHKASKEVHTVGSSCSCGNDFQNQRLRLESVDGDTVTLVRKSDTRDKFCPSMDKCAKDFKMALQACKSRPAVMSRLSSAQPNHDPDVANKLLFPFKVTEWENDVNDKLKVRQEHWDGQKGTLFLELNETLQFQ